MRQHGIRILVAAVLALAFVLGWMWVDSKGQPRNVHWQPPEPLKPDFSGMIPPLPEQKPVDLGRFVATLERPLFSPSRRPPPPPPPPAPPPPPPPPPDPLATVHLYGVFAGDDGGGIIVRVDGKPRRVRISERIGAWTVTDIDNRNVTLVRGGETRILKLVHARPAAPAPAPVAGAPAGGAANTPAPAPAPTAAGQRLTGDDFVRDRTARRNAARARAGLPPLP
jgi:hypothetical protein